MLKNLTVFKSPVGWKPEIEQLNKKISVPNELGHRWSIIRDKSPMIEVGGQILLIMETQEKMIPASVVNKEMQLRIDKFVKETGDTESFKNGKFKRDLKESVLNELYARAFVTSKFTKIWIDSVNGFMCIDTTSESKVPDVIGLMHACGFPVMPRVFTSIFADTAMRKLLLSEDHYDSGFCVGRSCELVDVDGYKSIKYTNETLDTEDIRDHLLKNQKIVKKLDISYKDKIAFTLNKSMVFSKISLLDIDLIEEYKSESKEEKLDAELLIMADSYSNLITAVIDYLGGEKKIKEKREAA